MDTVLKEKINLGISACMYGCKVRYNKKGWNMSELFGRDQTSFIWHPVCPESLSGMGNPRSPIRVIGESGRAVLEGNAKIKNREGKDVTDMLIKGCNASIEALERANVFAFVYMEGSPSCGVYRTTLKNNRMGKPPGVFGAMLLDRDFFLIPANDLQSPVRRWDWKRRLYAFAWAKEVDINSKDDLFQFWHIVKFLCQEIDEKTAREIGKRLAELPKGFDKESAETLRHEVMMILRQPSSLEKIKNRLWKHYMYFKRKTGVELENVMEHTDMRNMNHIADELMLMEKTSFSTEVLFGAAPILYRGR